MGQGSTFQELSRSKLESVFLIAPPLDEQNVIAAFLDRETARIDTLIAKKERQIELLQEKRAALISHAVTKGLDPNAPMKDSGIEWLGEIPAHWEIKRLKHLVLFVTSGSRGWAQFYSDEGPIFIRISNLDRASIDLRLDDIQRVSPPAGTEGQRTETIEGDILISITAYIGTVGIVPSGLGPAFVNQHTALVRPEHGMINARWLAYCLTSEIVQPQFDKLLKGGTKDGLTLDDVRNLVLALPPRSAQDQIVMYLDCKLNRITACCTSIEESVTRLLEYRTALISAAVTGKIDVREASS